MDFEFDGKTLADFGCVMFSEGLSEDRLAVSAMAFDTIKSALSDISLKAAHTYEDNYSTTVLITKNCCARKCLDDPERPYYTVNGTNLKITLGYCKEEQHAVIDDKFTCNDELNLSDMEISALTKWLVRKQYKWFRWCDRYVWYRAQNKIEKIYVGEDVIGLAVTINTNAPYGFSEEIDEVFYEVDHMDIVDQTDEEGYIYPEMTVTFKESGDFELENTYDESVTRIKNVSEGETIVFRGDLQEIESSDASHTLPVDFNFVFPRLCNLYGENMNHFESNLDCDFNVKYRGIRKVGL